MDSKLRAAMPTRVTALGFIILILGGNAWFAYHILGAKEPDIVRHLFLAGLILTILGGLGMLAWKIKNLLYPPETEETNTAEIEQ